MGPTEAGWDVLLRIPATLGGGTYRITTALRDNRGRILDRFEVEMVLSPNGVVQYWASAHSEGTGVVDCDVLRVVRGSEACDGLDECTLSA